MATCEGCNAEAEKVCEGCKRCDNCGCNCEKKEATADAGEAAGEESADGGESEDSGESKESAGEEASEEKSE